jgi:hypothetical protein
MDNSNKKKYAQLGESAGSAVHRLRKMLLFDFAKQLGKDVCYRCNKKIEKLDEFSVEHKVPWLDSEDPKKLFFNLDNIAFSHLSCNCADARSFNKIAWPSGMGWCKHCKKFKNLKEFPPCKTHIRGQQCTACEAIRSRKRFNYGVV